MAVTTVEVDAVVDIFDKVADIFDNKADEEVKETSEKSHQASKAVLSTKHETKATMTYWKSAIKVMKM